MATLKSIKNKYLVPADGTVLGVTTNTENVAALSFKLATADSLSKFNLVDGFSDDYNDATGVDVATSTNEIRNADNYYSGVLINNGPAIDGYVETLFHGDGANSGTTFTDSSSNGYTVQSSGNIVTSTSSPKFGTASIHVPNATNDYIYWGANSSNLHLDANPFTVSFWLKTTHSSGTGKIFGRNNGSGGQHNFDICINLHSNGTLSMVINTNTEYASAGATTTAVNDGAWHHIEFVRNGANIYGFADGVLEGTTNVTTTSVINRESSAFYIGYMSGGHYAGAIFYMDEFEFSPGIARHTATFTPPSAPWGGTSEIYNNMTLQSNAFTAQADPTTARIILDETSAAGSTTLDTDLKAYTSRDNGTTFTQIPLADQGDLLAQNQGGIDSYTKLMLHCDGANDGTTFTDSSDSSHTVTAAGNAHTDTALKKFGTASGQLDGTGDYLSIPHGTDFNFDTDDFTVDFWFRVAVFNGYTTLWAKSDADYQGIQSWVNSSGAIGFSCDNDSSSPWVVNVSSANSLVSLNTWYHYAMVRNSNTFKVYLDGSEIITNTTTIDFDDSSADLRFGSWAYAAHNMLNGYVDEIRVSKGIARWTAAFTPPTLPYTTGTAVEFTRRLVSGSVDISGQPAGSNVKYKIETLNQAVGKQTRVYGTSMAWA